MIRVKYSWLIVLLAGLCWGCQEIEVLETYEQVKETTQPVPIVFNPYVLSQLETSADTRADLSYLSYIDPTNNADHNLWYFKYIPCLGLKTGTTNTWGGAHNGNDNYNNQYHYRFGRTATNSYIVGVYAFSHNSAWSSSSSAATANVMTNQPLLRVPSISENGTATDPFEHINEIVSKNGNARFLNTLSHWDYEPKKYWPIGEKVTFISYYPYQDYVDGTYYRDGTRSHANERVTLSGKDYWDTDDVDGNNNHCNDVVYPDADLTCITPPAKDAIGINAYTFKFRQLNNVQKHIDFLLGLKTYETKSDDVQLPLKHTLCAVQFNFDNLPTDFGLESGQTMKIVVKSIGFKGLYTKGDVYPDANGNIQWKDDSLANYNSEEITKYGSDDDAYMVTFEENLGKSVNPPFMKANADDRPTFTFSGGKWTYDYRTREQIYNNGDYGSGPNYGGSSRGFRYLLLVIPQAVGNNEDAYFEMNYDLSYTWSGGKASYKNTVARIKLSDSDKKSGGDTSQLFIANKMLVFNVKITPAGIDMDVQETDWEDEEERQLPIEKENGN